MQVLTQQPVPAYFAAYSLHDTRTTQILAAFGAIDRSDESRAAVRDRRSARRRLLAGQHASHPRRRARHVAASHAGQPAADRRREADPARAVARHRSQLQAGERGADARPDERGGEGAGRESGAGLLARGTAGAHRRHRQPTRSTRRPGRRACAACRRVFADDPLILRSQVSLTVEADNRYYVNSEGSRIVSGDVGCRIFIQGVTKAEDGMELPLYTSYFATSPDGLPDERQLIAEARAMMDLLARLRKAPLVEPVLGPGDSVGPRRRRLLPRDLRPPRRRQPAAQRRRRPDVHAPRRPAGPAAVPQRGVRSDAEEGRQASS